MKDSDPPLNRLKQLAGVAFFSFIIPISIFSTPTTSPVVPGNQMIIIRGNSVQALPSPGNNEKTYKSLTGIPTLDRIIQAESSNRWWVKNPHSSAYGYCQMIAKTRRYVEKKWQMKINWQDPAQQLYACKRLYLEEGTRHWLSSKSKWQK